MSSYRHDLEIKANNLFLDGFNLKGVTSYQITNSASDKHAELVLKIHVNNKIERKQVL
ncbi:hypothetical protein HXA35_20620 [Bacillus sp. A301a_S52]|jgi:hypothetical protein|nr:hypothetical protein [Bacillus sp. A301a_S52]